MRIVLIGPGALGCLLAASLALEVGKDHDIRLLDHDPDRAARLASQGLILEKEGRRRPCHPPVTADPMAAGRADIVLLCVKSGATAAGFALAAGLLAPGSILVTLQNGIGHLELLGDFPFPVALGVTSLGATLTGPGEVRYAGRGPTRLGFITPPPAGSAKLADHLAALLNRADIATTVVDNILEHVWAKLLVNTGINALTAILGCPNGELPAAPENRERLSRAVREAEAVARANHIAIRRDPVEATLAVCRATAGNISSMLQDIRNRKPTEIDAINGAVVREGHRLGIPVPMNEELVRSVRAIESRYVL